MRTALISMLSVACAATAGLALPALPLGGIDFSYEGYSWETDEFGGYPPAYGPGVAGNILNAIGNTIKILDGTGVVELYDPENEGAEVTFLLSGLVSQGATGGGGIWETDYVGGTLEMYFDETPDYDPATGPGTYSGVSDGVLWVQANVVNFHTSYDSVEETGSYIGTFEVTGGAGLGCFDDLWTWGASSASGVPCGWTYTHKLRGDLMGQCIPEPGTMIMLGSALVGVVGMLRRRIG